MNNLLEQGNTNVGSSFPYFIGDLELSLGTQSGKIEAFPRKGTGAGNQTATVGDSWNGELDISMPDLVQSGILINGDFQELQLRGLLTLSTNYTGIVELCLMFIPHEQLLWGTSSDVTLKVAGTFIADSLSQESNQIILNIPDPDPNLGQGYIKNGMLMPLYYNRNTGANVVGNFVGDIFGI